MASNATLNIHNNVLHQPESFTTSDKNTVNSVNDNSNHENNENQKRSFVNYSLHNNYVHENDKITNRKRRLSTSSNTSLSSHTLINNNIVNNNIYDDNRVTNNPNNVNSNYQIYKDSCKTGINATDPTTFCSTTDTTLAATQNHSTNDPSRTSNHQMNISNNLPMSLFHTSPQPHTENIYIPNKNKKQKIEYNTQPHQNKSQSIEKIIHHQQIDKEIKKSSQKRVDSFINDNTNNENNMSKEEFDIPNSMDYMYTREGQRPSLIKNTNQPCIETDNEINHLDEENELNKNQCYYHNKTSINNLNNKQGFENDANIDKFSKFNKKIIKLTNCNTNINDSTSIPTLKTLNNRNDINSINNINNTISIKNKNKITPTSPTAVFHQTIEYPINVNVNTSTTISIPQVTTTTTIKPLIQNSTNLYNHVNKDNTPITTTTTLIPYSFQTSNAPIATFSTVTTTHSPKISPQNGDNNANGTSSLMAIDGLHVSSPYYQNIYNNNNYIMSQMGNSSYNMSSLSNSPKSPVRQQSNNISNKNVLFHSPLRNSINNNSDNECNNNNMSYPYYKNNGQCYHEPINEEKQIDGNTHNDMNQQQKYNYCNSTGNIVKNKVNVNHQSLLKNITTSNYLKRNMNQPCNSPIKKNISNLNMYIVDQGNEHNESDWGL